MNHIQLFLNDKSVDLSDDSPIALTFQINDLAEVQNQQGNTSNQFKIPLTQNNRAILGYADDITIEIPGLPVQTPYSRMSARLVQNGIEIFPNAIAEINQVDSDTASITILSGNVDFFDSLGGQLADMGDSTSQWSGYGANLVWKQFDHPWNLNSVAGSQTHTAEDGWIYPVIDYGNFDPLDHSTIDVRNQRPGFFIKKAIDLLIQSTGYTAKGSLLSDPLYPLLIAQFSNGSWEHGTDYQNKPAINGFTSTKSDSSTITNASGNIHFAPVSNVFDGINYIAPNYINGTVTVLLNFYMKGHPGQPGNTKATQLTIGINARNPDGSNTNVGTGVYIFDSSKATKVGGSGGGLIWQQTFNQQKISADVQLAPGMALNINYSIVDSSQTEVIIYPGSAVSFLPTQSNVLFGQMVQCERIFPDISQKDLLKDTLQRFGIICQADVYTKSIIFSSLKDIVNNIPMAKDWSQKCVDQGKQLNYKLGSYAQVNYMEYQTDPNITPLRFGWDQIIINDQTLSTVPSDMIVSKFGPSINSPFYGGTTAQIKMIDNTTAPATGPADFTTGVQPRILVDNKIDLRQNGGKTVTFTDGTKTTVVNDIISVPYFYKDDGEYNLCWCDKTPQGSATPIPGLRSKYYSPLQKILQNTKILVRYFLLTPRDIAELDLLIPIYLQQHNAYFYINKIDSWRKGQPCKVELVRLG
jgi:hypothetical protein